MSNQPNPNVFFRGEDMGIGNFPIKGGKINDGGPAFPTAATATTHGFYQDGQPCMTHYGSRSGITVRDYFAAAALQGNIAHPEVTGNRDDIARDAYKYADAMLKAREAK
jgi:hypothetical protein